MPTEKPADRYHAVYLICFLNGLGWLMPWTMWITIAPSYYLDYKLIEVDEDGEKHKSPYTYNFLSYVGLASNLPNLLLNFINIFMTPKKGLVRRMVLSLSIMALICLITLIFTLIDTSHMVSTFFYLTIITVVIQNAANGVYQNSLFGIAAVLPPNYTNAIILGDNMCGVFVAIVNIITLVVASNIQTSAFLYFFITLLTVIVCIGSLALLVRLDFYKYYTQITCENLEMKKNSMITEDERNIPAINGTEMAKVHKDSNFEVDGIKGTFESKAVKLSELNLRAKLFLYYDVFKKIWIQCFNVWFVLHITLTLFPAVMAEVEYYSKSGEYDFFISQQLFIPVTTYLLFNSFASLGVLIAHFVQWPSPKWLVVLVLAQIVFVPLMVFSNFRPAQRTWGVWIYNIWIYLFIASFMSIFSGYLSTLAVTYAPRLVEPSKASVAGMIAGFFLMLGVVTGIAFTFPVSWFVDNAGPYPPGKY